MSPTAVAPAAAPFPSRARLAGRGLAGTWLALGLAFAPAARALTVTGQAVAPDTGKALYTEVREIAADGSRMTITYTAADGTRLGTKTVDFGRFPYVPVYRLTLDADGYTEALTQRGAEGRTVALEKQSRRGAAVRTATVGADEGETLTAGPGSERFIADHLAELAAGKTLPFRLAVPGRLDSYRLRVKKTGTARDGLELLIEPDSLLRLLTPDLHLVFDPATKRLVRYEGISDVQDPATGKAFPAVRLVFRAGG